MSLVGQPEKEAISSVAMMAIVIVFFMILCFISLLNGSLSFNTVMGKYTENTTSLNFKRSIDYEGIGYPHINNI